MKEYDKESIITKYAIDKNIFNRIGKYVEENCAIQSICEQVKVGQHCEYFRMEIEEILSGEKIVDIEGLSRKEEPEELNIDLWK